MITCLLGINMVQINYKQVNEWTFVKTGKKKFMICSIVERIEFSKIQTEYI